MQNSLPNPPEFLWQLFKRLRLRQFPLGPDDWDALRQALQAGFGWSSPESLQDLCCALWAKSQRDQEVVIILFEQLFPTNEHWQLTSSRSTASDRTTSPRNPEKDEQHQEMERTEQSSEKLATQPQRGLPPISLAGVHISPRPFVLVPQFPLSYREIAQAWRRLRRPVRLGPPIELDLEGTIARRSQTGIACPIVLKPRRCNLVRLLLMVDRQGSMNPFHALIDEICQAIQQSARLNEVALYYFHNVPVEGADETVLACLDEQKQMFPPLDAILPLIEPLVEGYLYEDADLLSPQPLKAVLEDYANGAAVVLLGDAGAARHAYNGLRLLDTIAFLKALRHYTKQFVWLNPLPRRYWTGTTAAQLARHVPMFPLERDGIHRAVNVLRGQQYVVERTL